MNRIFRVTACFLLGCTTVNAQTINVLAGNGMEGFKGDSSIARFAQLNGPADVALDRTGNVYIADWYNARIRKVTPGGKIFTIAGTGTQGYSGDAGPATAAKINYTNRIAVDRIGNIYLTDVFYNSIRKIDTAGIITTIAGIGKPGYSGDNEPAIFAALNYPAGIVFDAKGNVLIADRQNNCIRKIDENGIMTTIAGGNMVSNADSLVPLAANITAPNGLATDKKGNLYIPCADHYIRKMDTAGHLTLFAGNGMNGYTGDGGSATMAALNNPVAVSTDTNGNVFIADMDNHKIRMVNAAGIMSSVAGCNKEGYGGDGGNALTAMLNSPNGLAADNTGHIYVADNGNNRVRIINLHERPMVTVCGLGDNKNTNTTRYTPPPYNNLGHNVRGGTYNYPSTGFQGPGSYSSPTDGQQTTTPISRPSISQGNDGVAPRPIRKG